MKWKEKRMYSILNGTCPNCHIDKVFPTKNPFNPSSFAKMNEVCKTCGYKYEREPGYFYGAMYVAYGVSIAFSLTIFFITYFLFPETPYWMYIFLITGGLIVLAPVTFRVGRMIWMNLFTGYKKYESNAKL